jgi:hypothetical protein
MFLHFTLYLLLLLISLVAIALNILSLPGNWLTLAAAMALSACYGWHHWIMLPMILIVLLLGEVVEFASGMFGAKTFGASRAAAWGAVGGTIIGGLVGIPPLAFLMGIDHLIAAILGAFLGAWMVELIRGRPLKESSLAALGAGLGRGVGLITKVGGGLFAWLIFAVAAFPLW